MTINKYEAAFFSDVSYSDNLVDFDLDQSYKSQGWTKITDSDKLGLSINGYYGTAYAKIVNGTVADVVIAHRGTEPNIEDIVIADGAIALQLPTNSQVDEAKSFAQKVMELVDARSDLPNNVDPNSLVTQTGHSLGGYLAIHAANQQSIDSGSHIKAITFDNPKTGITSTNAIIETYLNAPGLVNSAGAGKHLGTVYRLDVSSPEFNGTVVSTLNAISIASIENPITTLKLLTANLFLAVPYLKIAEPLIKQAIAEHPLGSIISRLGTAKISDANYTTNGAIEYYLVGDYSSNSNSAVGGVVAKQWELLEDKAYYHNSIKEYADSFLSIVRAPGYEYSAKNAVFGTNSSEVINVVDDGETKIIASFAGDDTINLSEGKAVLDAGSGNDTITYANYDNGLFGFGGLDIELSSGANHLGKDGSAAVKDIFDNVENVIGSKYSDLIKGTNEANKIWGGDGDDLIEGWQGNDIIYGGAGHDNISGDEGDDILDGGDGNDNINGGEDKDTIYGDAGNDNISGDEGDDFLSGGSGNDTINGGKGIDTLIGNSGDDVLDGGEGNDFIYGYDGFDTYNFNGTYGFDTISDSDHLGKIVINGIDLSGTAKTESSTNSNSVTPIYKLASNGKTYDLTLLGGDLFIREENDLSNGIVIKGFKNGSFGITLDEDTNSDKISDWINSALQSFANAVLSAVRPKDPLIIDTNNNGLKLSSWQSSGVKFDMDANGTSESTGWTTPSNSNYQYNKGTGAIIIDAANANLIDRIVFGSGISKDDLTFSQVGVFDSSVSGTNYHSDLVIAFGDDQIQIGGGNNSINLN